MSNLDFPPLHLFVLISLFFIPAFLIGVYYLSYYFFNLYFPNGSWDWTSFLVLFCLLYIFFHDMSVHVFCPFSNWVACLFFTCWILRILYVCWMLVIWASLVAQMVKNLPAGQETWLWSLGWEDPLEGGRGNPLQYCCLENPMDLRSLAGCSLWGHKESDMTEWLSTTQHSHLSDMWFAKYFLPVFNFTYTIF